MRVWPSRLVRFGVFEFDVETGDLWNRGHRSRLQDQPRRVLLLLLEHPGELVTREALRAELWPNDTFVDFDVGVNVVVNKIRHVLRDSASSPRFIETLPRRGYRFIAPVAFVPAHDDVGDQPTETSVVAGLSSHRRRFGLWRVGAWSAPPASRWLRRPAGTGAVALAAISAVVYLSHGDKPLELLRLPPENSASGHADAPTRRPAENVNEVAVAPFENRTGDSSLDSLGQSAAERISGVVATVSGVHVRPRPMATTADAIARSAAIVSGSNASLLVTGTYYAHENGLELHARILDAVSGRLLHGTGPVGGSRSHPAELLHAMEQKVAGAIAIHFDEFFGGLQAVSHPPSIDGYREYRAGLETFWSDYPRALWHLERAIEKDPGFLLPRMIAYIAHRNLGESAKLEPALVQMEHEWDRLTPAERLLIEWLRSNASGRRAQARRILEDLAKLVPASLFVNHNLVQNAVAVNRPRAAVDAYDGRRIDDRTFRHGIGTLRHLFVIQALHMLGEHARELREVELAHQYAPGDPHFFELEARALVALGRVAEVPGVIDRTLSITRPAAPDHSPGEVMEGVVRELRVHGYREESLALAARAIDWYRHRSPGAASGRAHRDGLARALYLAERWEESAALFSALAAEHPADVSYVAYLGLTAARMKDDERARAISARLAGVPADQRGTQTAFPSYGRSRIAALIGEPERAVELLRDALALGLPYGLMLHDEPDFELIRGHEAFVELLQPLD
jgi:DNA-binding winged helix-turn-helix (wHTH) protein/TolB-like protein/tetratricopeptide (TPR) repeat protein